MEDPFASQREQMVAGQIARRGILDPRLLAVLREIPRHLFVPANQQQWAYEDGPLSIGLGQTISQPYIVALMTNLCQLEGGETVLEIGTGSGYQAAILGKMAGTVHTMERHMELAARARQVLDELEIHNVHIHLGDGSTGWAEAAPYHAIVVTAAAPRLPPTLLEQLAPNGRLVIPVGSRFSQTLQVWIRLQDRFLYEDIIPVVFVPLLGKNGWTRDDASGMDG